MREEDDMLLRSISQGPSRVFVLAKGAVPPEDEQDGHNGVAGAKTRPRINLGLDQRQGEKEGEPGDAHRRLTLLARCGC